MDFSFIEPLAAALGTVYVRFGGTEADTLIFNQNRSIDSAIRADERCEINQSSPFSNFTFTGKDVTFNFDRWIK